MRPEVWDAMAPYATDVFGNASGSHGVSRRAKDALEGARERVAAMIGAHAREIVFTSGGTEADNLAVKGTALRRDGTTIVTSAMEHEAVLEAATFCERRGSNVVHVGVDSRGRIDPREVAEAVDPDTAVVSVMLANNETGVIQPIGALVDAVGGRALVHTDAVQAFCTLDVDVEELAVDLLSLSAHKFGGPKGVGVLYVRDGVALEPTAHGGGQELGRRSGTSNVMGAIGMATAMELAAAHRHRVRMDAEAARQRFAAAVVTSGVAVPTVDLETTLVTHAHLRFPGIRNESLLVRLDLAGVAVSVGSACSSGAATVSHVLAAMGRPADEARETLRFSFGWTTSPADGDEAAAKVLEAVEALR